jgi:transposase
MRLPPAALEPEQLTRGYQRTLQAAGLATKNGNLRIARLVSLVKERYRGVEELPGLSPLKAMDDQWPGLAASLSRRISRPGHPLKHLLLIGAISDSWDQFIEACAPPTTPLVSTTPALEVDSASRLVRFKELITVHGKSVRAASHALGVTTTTGTQWARKLKIAYTSRGKPLPETTGAKIRRMLENGDSISSIASSAGVSMTTVYRMVESDPATSEKRATKAFSNQQALARRNFATICRTQSDRTLRQIRSNPGNSYMWLYRNDHQWLAGELAEHGRISSRSR